MLPVVRVMSRLGLALVTAIMTVLSAFLSMFVAWIFGFFIHVPNYGVHILLAFVIPFFVTPMFSAMTALSIRDLQKARRRASEMALLDPLTGIANRRAFFDILAKRMEPAHESSRTQGVLFIDIDHFKDINDRWGHAAGDAVLKDFANLLKSSMREGDLIARMGGEEFVVHLLDVSPSSLAVIAAGIGATVRSHTVTFEATTLRYTVSIGAAIGGSTHTIDQLLSAADHALYRVKNSGRDSYSVADVHDTAERAVVAGEARSAPSSVNSVRVA